MMIKSFEQKFWDFLETLFPKMHGVFYKRRLVVKYIMAGGTAASVNLVILYILTDIFDLWYIFSAILSFIVAFVVSFCFQKFWAFEDSSTEKIHAQMAVYFMVAVVNLCLNTFLIYSFVEYFGLHYLLAQICAGIIIACESFFVYRLFIFKNVHGG